MNLLRKITSTAAGSVVAFSSLLTLAVPGIAHAAAQNCSWVGTGSDLKFSTAANWSCDTGTVPVDGSAITIDRSKFSVGTSYTTYNLTNDLASVAFSALSFTGASASSSVGVYVSVDTATMADGGTITTQQYNVNNANSSVTTVTSLGSVIDNNTQISNTNIAGSLTLSNTYLYVSDSTKFASLIAQGADVEFNQPSSATVTVPFDITFNAGTGWSNSLSFDQFTAATAYTLTGQLTLNADTTIATNSSLTTVNITKAIAGAGKLSYTDYSTGDVTVAGTVMAYPAKTTTLDAKSSSYISVGRNETTDLNNMSPEYVEVYYGGTLKGQGTIKQDSNGYNGILYVDEGGTVSPGNSPGCITADRLVLDGIYTFEYQGTDACTGYDQLKVTNGYNASSTTTILNIGGDDNTAVLNVAALNGYVPKVGQTFTIIDNQSNQAVKGTFKGLAEGATVTSGGVTFTISYKGGDGNDVVLTVTSVDPALAAAAAATSAATTAAATTTTTAKTPNTGFALATANNLVALASTAVVAGGLVLVSRKLSTQVKK